MQQNLFERVFRIRPEERETALLLFAQCLCVIAAAFIAGRTLAATLFLHRIDPVYLPYTYVLSAVTVSVVSLLYSRVADRFRRDSMILVTALGFSFLCLLARLALVEFGEAFVLVALIYVFFDVVGDLSLIQFWTLASDLLSARQAKRVFGFVAAGGTVAGVVVGGAIAALVPLIGAPNLLFVVILFLLFSALIVRRLGHLHGETLASQRGSKRSSSEEKRAKEKTSPNLGADLRRVFGSSYPLVLAALLATGTVVTILVDYQWKLAARQAYLGDEAGLAAYFSYFALVTNGVALFVQVFITSRLLTRFGIGAALSILPASLGLSLLGGLGASGVRAFFLTSTLAKGSDGAFRYSIYQATMQVLYRPIADDFRGRAKALLEGVAKPVFAGLSGLAIAALSLVVAPERFGWLSLPMTLLWLGLIALTRRLYVKELSAGLSGRGGLNASELKLDQQTRRTLMKALTGDDPAVAHNALQLLWGMDNPAERLPLSPLLQPGEPEDQDRRALCLGALRLLSEKGVGPHLEAVEAKMNAEDPEIRAEAIACVLRQGGLGAMLAAAHQLEGMFKDSDASIREAAAGALGTLAESRFHAPLYTLLEDPNPRVRIAAAHAACRAPAPQLMAPLVRLLDRGVSRGAAIEALIAQGNDALPALSRWLEDAERAPQDAALRVLERLATPEAIALLWAQLKGTAEEGHAALLALGRLAESGALSEGTALARNDPAAHTVLLEAQLHEVFRWVLLTRNLGPVEPALLGDALHHAQRRRRARVLAWLSLLHRGQAFTPLGRALEGDDSSGRASALELLDNMVEGPLRAIVLAVFEERDPSRRAMLAQKWAPHLGPDFSPPDRSHALNALLKECEDWSLCCVIYEQARSGELNLNNRALAEHPISMVRETFQSAQDPALRQRATLLPSFRPLSALSSVPGMSSVAAESQIQAAPPRDGTTDKEPS